VWVGIAGLSLWGVNAVFWWHMKVWLSVPFGALLLGHVIKQYEAAIWHVFWPCHLVLPFGHITWLHSLAGSFGCRSASGVGA